MVHFFFFQCRAFVRNDEKTIIRTDWEKHTSDVSKSINEWVLKNYRPNDSTKKSFDDWSEDMIVNFGDEIIPNLKEIWETVSK